MLCPTGVVDLALPWEARCCLATSTRKRYLIIGNGASGTYAAETIRKTDTEGEITLLTNEPYPLYNRVALPPFLRDECSRLLGARQNARQIEKRPAREDFVGTQFGRIHS